MASHVLPLLSLLLTTSPSFHSLHPAFLNLTDPSFHPQQLSIIVEFIAGRITQTLDRLIALYRPDSLVVGTRGQRTVMQALGMAGFSGGALSISFLFTPIVVLSRFQLSPFLYCLFISIPVR